MNPHIQKILLILAIVTGFSLTSQKAYGQSEPLHSQYMLNKFLINPATAGYQGITSFNLTARENHLGFPGSNRFYSISGQTRILRTSYLAKTLMIKRKLKRSRPSGRVGLGFNIFTDQNGAIGRTGGQLTYSYHIHIRNSQLSMGLTGSMFQFKLHKDNFTYIVHEGDDLLEGKGTLWVPDFNFGALYSFMEFYGGLSVKNLLQSSINFGNGNFDEYNKPRTYYLLAGYNHEVNTEFDVEGSLLLQAPEQNLGFMKPTVSVKGFYQDDYWTGFSYRTGESLIFLAGVGVKKFYFGYSFDYSLNEIQSVSYGSHEIMFGVKFGESNRRYRWINRF